MIRKTWVWLCLWGAVPGLAFYVLDWCGATQSLQYISTTSWQFGHPSIFELAALALSLLTWLWLKVLVLTFGLAAIPFAIADLFATIYKR